MTRPFAPYFLAWTTASLLLLTALMMVGAYASRERDFWVNHSLEVLQDLDAFEAATLAVELSSADVASDISIAAELERARSAVKSLTSLSSDNPSHAARCKRMSELLDRATARQEALRSAPLELRNRFDRPFAGLNLRNVVNEFRKEEQTLLSKRQKDQESADRRFWWLAWLVLALNIFTVWWGYRSAGRWAGEKAATENAIRSLNARLAYQVAEIQQLNASLEHKVTEKTAELEKLVAKLQSSNSELERFTYVAAHDLQEPLRQVVSFSNLLEQKYAGQLDETAHRYLTYSNDGAKRLQNMLNGLLQYTLITPSSIHHELFGVEEMAASVVEELKADVAASGAVVKIEDAGHLTVVADRLRIRSVLHALLTNALKFHHPGALPVIGISFARDDGSWTMSVTDNGIGIDERFNPRVFEMFARLHPVGRYPGIGVGLALSKKIVEYHGGSLRVSSSPDGHPGSRFVVTIPALPITTQPEAAATSGSL